MKISNSVQRRDFLLLGNSNEKQKQQQRLSLSLHFKWQSFSQEDKLRDKNSPHHHQKCRYSLSAVLRARATETGNGFLLSGTFLRRFYATFLNQFWLNLYQIEFKRCKIEIKSLFQVCVFSSVLYIDKKLLITLTSLHLT